MLSLSLEGVRFGMVFPGNIFEEQVEVRNSTDEELDVKVVVLCSDTEFDSHSEYVFSIRMNSNYDYNEKLTFTIPA